ncbi:MAG TPA: hypothetical protein DDY13_13345 [Cytophagales bacterium]|jgi:hypothetical protein|nr:hypothetical protein [Cytophagales bacterium]
MKKRFKKPLLFLLLPFLLAFHCEEENTGFETLYLLQNDSRSDLFLIKPESLIIEIESKTTMMVGSALNSETSPILPSESFVFNGIKLYKMDSADLILVYDQDPLNDDLWVFNEPSVNRFEYKLVITDALID